MLYDPKWEQKTREPSLVGFVAWLETKDPKERFEYWSCSGSCAVDQYLEAIGSELVFFSNEMTQSLNNLAHEAWSTKKMTFGGLLKIARETLVTEQ